MDILKVLEDIYEEIKHIEAVCKVHKKTEDHPIETIEFPAQMMIDLNKKVRQKLKNNES